MASYRKTRDGTWAVFGPTSEVRPGPVVVTKKNGETKTEIVESLGRAFMVDGIEHVYGYIAPRVAGGGYRSRGGSGGSARGGARKRACKSGGNAERLDGWLNGWIETEVVE